MLLRSNFPSASVTTVSADCAAGPHLVVRHETIGMYDAVGVRQFRRTSDEFE